MCDVWSCRSCTKIMLFRRDGRVVEGVALELLCRLVSPFMEEREQVH